MLEFLAGCAPQPVASLVARGLNQPRGMAFDSDGHLFVAETGAYTADEVHDGPPGSNHSGRVLRIDSDRRITPVMEALPFTQQKINGDTGVTDVAVLDGDLYVLIGEGLDDNLSRRLLQASSTGRARRVANLLDIVTQTTTAQDMDVGRIKANPFAMIAAPDGAAFYVSDGASGRILHVELDGDVRVFAETPGMPPLAGMSFGPDGRLYVAVFSHWPHTPGSGAIWAADSTGGLTPAVAGLTMPIDVAFDKAGSLFAIEFSDGRNMEKPYAAWSGRLLRIAPDGAQTVLLDHLNYPTAMLFSPTGDLFIAVGGAFTGAGHGAIIKLACQAISERAACAP